MNSDVVHALNNMQGTNLLSHCCAMGEMTTTEAEMHLSQVPQDLNHKLSNLMPCTLPIWTQTDEPAQPQVVHHLHSGTSVGTSIVTNTKLNN